MRSTTDADPTRPPTSPKPLTPNRRIGLIAGNGPLPAMVARAAKREGHQVFATALVGETTPSLAPEVDAICWCRVGQLARMVAFFRRHAIAVATMAGGVRKTRWFGRAAPDWLALRTLYRVAVRGDDSLLSAIADVFESRGIAIIDATTLIPEVLAPRGILGVRVPSPAQREDIEYGVKVLHALGPLDIGQTVVVRDRSVVAVEALEGTDACIRRAGALTRGTGCVVVKAAKVGQDLRFDRPAVGPETFRVMKEAGAGCLAVAAEQTMILEPTAAVAQANASSMAWVGVDDNGHY